MHRTAVQILITLQQQDDFKFTYVISYHIKSLVQWCPINISIIATKDYASLYISHIGQEIHADEEKWPIHGYLDLSTCKKFIKKLSTKPREYKKEAARKGLRIPKKKNHD